MIERSRNAPPEIPQQTIIDEIAGIIRDEIPELTVPGTIVVEDENNAEISEYVPGEDHSDSITE